MKVMIGHAVKVAAGGAGALALTAGFDASIVASSAIAGLVADEALDALKERALEGAHQQVNVAIGHASPFIMRRLPRLELADPKATGADVARYIEQHYRRNAEEVFGGDTSEAAQGHCSSVDNPAYD